MLDFNRLSSTPALFRRETAAKSLSMLNNSITAMQNTHTTLLKPGHFRREEFIDFKLLPLGPLTSGKKTKQKNNRSAYQSAACAAPRVSFKWCRFRWGAGEVRSDSRSVWHQHANVSPHSHCSSSEGFYMAVWFLLRSNGLFYNGAHLCTKCVTKAAKIQSFWVW